LTEEISLSLAFTVGLFGALHCLGMCSGIAGGMFVRLGGRRPILPVLAFHGTRVLVYALLGAAGAALGRVLVQTGVIGKGQGLLMMTAGILISVLGLDLLGIFARWRTRIKTIPHVRVPVHFAVASRPARPWLPALARTLNGFVPCSLVFSVAVKAAATADPLRAGLLMTAFGLGTVPTMGLVSLTGAFIGANAGKSLLRVTGLAVFALGLWTFYEGLMFYDVMRGLGNW